MKNDCMAVMSDASDATAAAADGRLACRLADGRAGLRHISTGQLSTSNGLRSGVQCVQIAGDPVAGQFSVNDRLALLPRTVSLRITAATAATAGGRPLDESGLTELGGHSMSLSHRIAGTPAPSTRVCGPPALTPSMQSVPTSPSSSALYRQSASDRRRRVGDL